MKSIRPPERAARILDSLSQRYNLQEIGGDLYELFYKRVESGNPGKAKFLFWIETTRAILSMWITYQRRKEKSTSIFTNMILSNIKIGIRHIIKRPAYSFITIIGLALGISACLLIFDYVRYERSFDKQNPLANRIVMMQYHFKTDGHESKSPAVPFFVGPKMMREFPEVELQTRILPTYGARIIKAGENIFEEKNFGFADSTLLDVLSYPLAAGNSTDQLKRPNTALLSKQTALRFYGNENPIGKTFTYNDAVEYEVTGILEDLPSNSHINFDFFLSLSSLKIPYEERFDSPNYLTYLLLAPDFTSDQLEEKINAEWKDQMGPTLHLALRQLNDVHFDTTVSNYGGNIKLTDARYLFIFTIVAGLVLLIACINYVTLVTARANERGREVGIRKLSGALNVQLSIQFLLDSFLHILPAILIALLIFYLAIPHVNTFLGLSRGQLTFVQSLPVLKFAALILLVVAILAGVYPAVILSRMKPSSSLKGKFTTSRFSVSLRKTLVVFQFSISIALIIGSLVVTSQLNYMRNKKLGFDKEHVLILSADNKMFGAFNALTSEMEKMNFIKNVSAASAPPTEIVIGHGIYIQDLPEDLRVVGGVHVVDNFLETMNIQLIAGRNFSPHRDILTDSGAYEFIVNQTFLTKFGLNESEVLGREMNLGGPGKIIGIVQDFHPGSLHQKIEPIVMFAKPHPYIPLRKLILKLEPGDVQTQLSELNNLWKKLVPHRPFNYDFLDASYDSLYKAEAKVNVLVYVFSGLAIVIACLGILGLASYSTIQRTKEIGVRKVLGASVYGIMILIAKDFIMLVAIAFIVAAPLAYFFSINWLQNFEYRISLQIIHFVGAGLLAFLFAICTIAYQAFKSSRLNPTVTLKSE